MANTGGEHAVSWKTCVLQSRALTLLTSTTDTSLYQVSGGGGGPGREVAGA
jgi:hypothetical protein